MPKIADDDPTIKSSDPAEVAIRFLDQLRPCGPWVLIAIHADHGLIETITAETAESVRAFVNKYDRKRNLYYSLNPTKRPMGKKPSKADISQIEYLPLDLDPRSDEQPEEAKVRYLAAIESYGLAPAFLVSSGNGINAAVRLKTPRILGGDPVKDADKIADIESRTLALTLALGGTRGTQNIDRILRLPGTLNIPNAKKRKDGRVPRRAKLIKCNDAVYRLDTFPPAASDAGPSSAKEANQGKTFAPVDVDALPVSQRIKNLIRGKDDPEHPYSSRSERMMAVLVAMAAAGCSDVQMTDLMFDPSLPIRQHLREQPHPDTYLTRQIRRARERVQPTDQEQDTRPLTTRTLDKFERIEVTWLFRPFIPLGLLTVFIGDSGVGKTTIINDLTARVTTGKLLPTFIGEKPQRAPKGSVILLSKEDDFSRMIRPRIEAAGADLSKVHVLGYDVSDDPNDFQPIERLDTTAKQLEDLIVRIGDVRMIHIDPITDFAGSKDIYRDDQIRALLNPIGRLASKYDLAVIYVLHLNKKTDLEAKYRALASVAFRNVSRSCVVVAPDNIVPGQRLMMQDKINILAEASKRAAAFNISTAHGQPVVRWEAQWYDEFDVDSVLTGKPPTKQKRAAELLAEWLADGPVAQTDLVKFAKEHDISLATLRLAKKASGIEDDKDGKGKWMWRLP